MISTLHSPMGPCALRTDCAESDGVRASPHRHYGVHTDYVGVRASLRGLRTKIAPSKS